MFNICTFLKGYAWIMFCVDYGLKSQAWTLDHGSFPEARQSWRCIDLFCCLSQLSIWIELFLFFSFFYPLFDIELTRKNKNNNFEVEYNTYLVWKMFWIMFLGYLLAAYFNWSNNSSELRRQQRASKFSSACFTVLTPGIGIAPLQMHQFIATC
jgi:hypothetical protein